MSIMKKVLIITAILAIGLISCKDNENHQEELLVQEPEFSSEFNDQHTAKNSLDWVGEYQGTLPCADCEGIKTTIVLHQDETFSSKEHYLKEPVVEIENKGSFTWDETGFIVTLEGDNFKRSYRVVERAIIHLDNNENEITGELAEYYRLAQK